MQHNVFRHAAGQVGLVDAHDRDVVRQRRVFQDRVNARTKRHDDLEIGQALHHAGGRKPGGAVFDVGHIAHAVRPDAHIEAGCHFPHGGGPDIDRPCWQNEKECHY